MENREKPKAVEFNFILNLLSNTRFVFSYIKNEKKFVLLSVGSLGAKAFYQ